MSDLKRIQVPIVINGLRVVTLVDSGATRNVISIKFVAKHGLRTVRKQLVTELYSFDEKRVEEDVSQELSALIKVADKISNIIFDVVDTARDVFLRYPWLRDQNPLIDWAERKII